MGFLTISSHSLTWYWEKVIYDLERDRTLVQQSRSLTIELENAIALLQSRSLSPTPSCPIFQNLVSKQ
ncbi:hypothetical protein [Limnofasciculus baicalensis]|uniref:Uncharacterized protein n=1 Tax=Limnofasciculus baicalensis BBK-W-15 TaxID=2699891 RepID=A0AAE3GUC8_9CYAN|nr:hypothetical protein [Limnofasciculus baicalensis]MCP2730826.1 hypothetical protein [Limnofasciculus baicalensis BBK-W-15]